VKTYEGGVNRTVSGTYTERFALLDQGWGLRFGTSMATVATIDNVSVKQVLGNHATQANAAACPQYQNDGTHHWLQFDGVDDSLATTFSSALGSACTLGKAVKPSATVVGSQTVGTTYTQNVTHYGTVLTNDALTGQETTD